MCGFVIDALVLMGLVMALNQDSESPPFLRGLAAAVAIGLLTFGAVVLLVPALGIWGLLLVAILAAAIAGVVLWLVFDVPPPKAAIGGVVFLVYKIAFAFIWQMMTATPA